MESRRAYLTRIKQQMEDTMTKGVIQVRHDRRFIRFYYVNGNDKCYIPFKDRGVFVEAARNRFYKEAVRLIEMELYKKNVTFTYEAAFTLLPEEVRTRVSLEELLRDKYVEKWQQQVYSTMGVAEGTGFYTAGGEHVRSKSEVIIADMLKRYNVPYHYEPVLKFGTQVKCPDFLLLNIKDRKEYIWEHFGMMDNSEYCKDAIEKLSFYESNGYSLGDNLIITMESSLHSLDTRFAESMIKKYLV